LNSTQGGIFFFILVFLWLALLLMAYISRNFALGSLFWLVGIIMGAWLIQVGLLAAAGFLLLDTAIFLSLGILG
jgi:hypothetical protein